MKTIKVFLSTLLGLFVASTASANLADRQLNFIEKVYFDEYPHNNQNRWYWNAYSNRWENELAPEKEYFEHNSLEVKHKSIFEPTISEFYDPYDQAKTYSNYHYSVCPKTTRYGKLEFYNGRSKRIPHYIAGKTLKVDTVYGGIPRRFSIKNTKGIEGYLSDEFYFFAFGDGARIANKKGDDHDTVYTFPEPKFKPKYSKLVSSLTYRENKNFWFEFSYNINTGKFKRKGKFHDMNVLDLVSCDLVKVDVLKNTKPVAKFEVKKIKTFFKNNKPIYETYEVDTSKSYDTDAHPLSFTVQVDKTSPKRVGAKNYRFGVYVKENNTTHTVKLVASDGGKSDIATKAIQVKGWSSYNPPKSNKPPKRPIEKSCRELTGNERCQKP